MYKAKKNKGNGGLIRMKWMGTENFYYSSTTKFQDIGKRPTYNTIYNIKSKV
jgi:hypothetical protein